MLNRIANVDIYSVSPTYTNPVLAVSHFYLSVHLKRIRKLLESILETPYTGIGKPEPLKYDFSGSWSRRINITDRLIYELQENNVLHIYSMRGHYD